jgi:glycosyltransferase involved in cell wall biosynthesis
MSELFSNSSNLITFFLPNLRAGGAERVSIDLAYAFKEEGYKVDFLLLIEDGEFLQEARQHFHVTGLQAVKARSSIVKLAKYLRTQRPIALISNMWPLTSISVIGRILSLTKSKLLLVEHITLSNQYASWGRLHNCIMQASIFLTYRFADKLVGVSEGASLDTAKLAGLPVKQFSVIYNPIPIRPMPAKDVRIEVERLWGCPSGQRILAVGSLKSQKNYALLIKAFAALTRSQARLIIVGGGDSTNLKQLANDLYVADRVIFTGFRSDTASFYATADIFALSSDYEGFGNVIVEALSFGLPVVATDCPSGPAEILENGRWGRLVKVGDFAKLASAIDETLSIQHDRDALMARAREFAPQIAAKKYLQLMGLPC